MYDIVTIKSGLFTNILLLNCPILFIKFYINFSYHFVMFLEYKLYINLLAVAYLVL